ncbi:transposase [Rhodococcus sp. NPDC057014]|uniref:transposase n=1 Tax=Rhodococcus sp. NPDC057014 TaxID=3346000 RepID=UPI0036382E4A
MRGSSVVAGFIKGGDRSPGVARQHLCTLGEVGNCQIAVSLHAASDSASTPLDWRLFLPEIWDDRSGTDPARSLRHCPPAMFRDYRRLAPPAQMGDSDRDDRVGGTPPIAVADAGYGGTTAFRLALIERPSNSAAYSSRGCPPNTPATGPHTTCKDLILAAGRKSVRTVT